MITNEKVAFQLICFDDSSVFEFQILDNINCRDLDSVYSYLNEHIRNYNIHQCKFLILPMYLRT